MKSVHIYFFSFAAILFSCNTNNNAGTLTANEDKGIKEIIGFYGGQCEYGFQKQIGTEGNGTNFWIKFSKSADIDSLESIAEMPGSNIAYIFYKDLDKEKTKYRQIETELVFGDGRSKKYVYDTAQLEKVKQKIQLVNKIVALIDSKNYSDLRKSLVADTNIARYDKEQFIASVRQIEDSASKIKTFVPYGFRFSKIDNNREMLHISGLIAREKNSNYFSVDLDPNSLQDEIYFLNYKL